ncbi:MAG: ABC transporter ATP-binding protein [Desulfomicrobiaceae bacterium]|nr:ABC transporter ATP-binding protein [Desulfomicrobiaceae bacterium]
MLKVEALEAGYAAVPILRRVCLDIAQGEIVSLLGGNGAGKTTTVKCLSGLVPATGGRILFADRDITALSAHERVAAGLVQVPEGRKVFASLSVLENLELGSYLPPAKKVRRQSLERVFTLFPILAERRNQSAGTLSGGEQQMLALARGLMALPHLLILDEPSLGLAPLVVEEIFRAISKINGEGVTVLLVEQHVPQALALSHRAFVLEDGAVVLQGTSRELLHDSRVQRIYLGMEECVDG